MVVLVYKEATREAGSTGFHAISAWWDSGFHFPDIFGADCGSDEEDKTNQDNINGKGQFNSDDNDYKDNDDGSEEDERGDDEILTKADIFVTRAYETLRDEEERMKTIIESGGKLSTADVNRLKFLRQELVPVYILSGINYSIINDTRGAATCFNSNPGTGADMRQFFNKLHW